MFREEYGTGRNKLYNVLKAYACYDNEIGYAQGVNYLAAMLLYHIEDEEKAFWCLIYVLHRRNWRMVYDNNTPKLLSLLNLLRERLNLYHPDLLAHLESEDLSMLAVFSPLFLTLYIYHIPLPISTRIFELFLLEGEVYLFRLLFRLLETYRLKIQSLREHELLDYLRCGMILECIQEKSIEWLLDV